MAASTYTFGDFRLERARFALLRRGLPVRIERKPLDLLILFAESDGRLVTRAEIARCLWGADVFVDTEHGINTAVRKLRAALRDDPDRPRFIETVTGMGYRFVAPVALLSPAEPELIPVAPSPAPPPPPLPVAASPAMPHRRLLTPVLLAVILCATAAALLLRHRATAAPAIRSVAVLPLANFSGNPDATWFADGMTDELITMLARNSTLRIPSRTSVMHLRTSDRSIQQIARDLGVDAVLEGSVSRSATDVHLNLQLIQASTDSHLWAQTYTRDLSGSAALPADAARDLAAALHSASAASAQRYVSPAAHDAYLRGQYLWSVGRNQDAGDAFEEAVRLQPDYALAWVGVSEYLGAGAKMGDRDPATTLPQARSAAERAVSLDPDLANGHLCLAAITFFQSWDGPRALRESVISTTLDPHLGIAWHLQALILSAMGRFPEALAAQHQATALDPINHPGAMAEILFFTHHNAEALAEARSRLRDFPNARDILYFAALSEQARGDETRAAPLYALFYAPLGDTHPNPAVLKVFAAGGNRAFSQWRLDGLDRRQQTQYVAPTSFAIAYAGLGDRAQAITYLEQALHAHDPLLLFSVSEVNLRSLEDDPRYRTILEQIHTETNRLPPPASTVP